MQALGFDVTLLGAVNDFYDIQVETILTALRETCLRGFQHGKSQTKLQYAEFINFGS